MKDSAIQWTDHTFNPWEGCTKVAPECKNCYAETLVDHRFGRAKWGKGQPRRRTSAAHWKQPLAWNINHDPNHTHATLKFRRARIFCASLSDWLDEEVPIEWLADLLLLIEKTPNLNWLLLTKRPQNWIHRIGLASNLTQRKWLFDWAHGDYIPDNIWIGVSAGADQKAALDIPAKIHFMSCEPMLHALDTTHAAGFAWIIFGGESGKNARACDVSWIRDGVAFCKANNIAAFVKQFGARPFENYEGADPTPAEEAQWHRNGWCKISFADGSGRSPVWSKNYRLRDSHGGDMSEWPEDLRVRQFPDESSVGRGTATGAALINQNPDSPVFGQREGGDKL